jgi:hypothetical protein
MATMRGATNSRDVLGVAIGDTQVATITYDEYSTLLDLARFAKAFTDGPMGDHPRLKKLIRASLDRLVMIQGRDRP